MRGLRFDRVWQSLLLDTLTPLGVLIYGGLLWWAECKLRAVQRSNPTDMKDLPDLLRKASRLRAILARDAV